MAYLIYSLLPFSFLLTVCVIISVVQKKYYGWKSFLGILRTVNILFVCILFAIVFYLLLLPHPDGGKGMELLLLPIPLFTLLIIDFILVTPYYFIRFWHDKSKRSIFYAALIPAIFLLFIVTVLLLHFLYNIPI